MAPKSYSLDFEPGEEFENKRTINSSPCATQVKILDQFASDGSGNMLIEIRKMQMAMNKQKGEIDRLSKQKEVYGAEVAQLQAQLQAERSSFNTQILELEDKVADLLAKNSRLRAEIALNISSDLSDAGTPQPLKKTILPSRWTRSQPNLKEEKPLAPSLSQDSIDLLNTQVSELGFNAAACPAASPAACPAATPLEMLKEPAVPPAVPSLDTKVLKSTTAPPTPRESRFTEDFSLDDALSSIAEEPEAAAVQSPKPAYESTFIGDSRAEPANPRLHKAFKSHPNIKLGSGGDKPARSPIRSPARLPARLPARSPPQTIFEMVSQVFVGETLYKHSRGFRKTEQHARYFWVHPYTLTLYWGKEGPSVCNSGTPPKSLPILGVSEEANLNAQEHLYHKSIIISAGKRNLKVTCTSSNQHNVWLRSLKHLLAGAAAPGAPGAPGTNSVDTCVAAAVATRA